MFNFFGEIKSKVDVDSFHIINISNKLIYIEGQRGLLTLSTEQISFKVKSGVFIVDGQNLSLAELTENTIKIAGKIKKVEFV